MGRAQIELLATGNQESMRNIGQDRIRSIRIPLPPVTEQRRIVAAIEEQFTRLDAAVASLRRARANLKRYRAGVLAAAIDAKLVVPESELAKALGRSYESAGQLLARIGGKNGSPTPSVATTPTMSRSLPEGWVWTTVGYLADVATGATPLRGRTDYYANGTVPWITSSATGGKYVDSANESITERALRETNAKVFPAGTLLVAMYGEGKTRGQVTELRIAAATNQALAALIFTRPWDDVRPFVKVFFANYYERLRSFSSGAVQPNLNLSIIRNTAIPLPPLPEQHRIVAGVERRLSAVEQLEASVEANLRRAQRLRHVMLKRALEGKLVAQDPTDEPASVFLERSRAERTSTNGIARRTTTRVKPASTSLQQQLPL
jgi:type I restriction enzyme, S subunit